MPAIIGAVVGVVGALALVGILGFFLYKRNKRNQLPQNPPLASLGNHPPGTSHGGVPDVGKPELDSTSVPIYSSPATAPLPPPSPHLSVGKHASPRTDSVSPVSAYNVTKPTGGFTPPPPPPLTSELHNQPYQPMPPELQAQQGYGAAMQGHGPPTTGPPLPPELQGQYARPQGQPMASELQGQYARPQGQPMASELQGGQYYNQNPQLPPELQGGQYAPTRPYQGHQQAYEFPAQNQVYEAYGQSAQPPRAEMPGGGWHSGQATGYQEMDSNYGQYRGQPHAR
jgi:hypothetical protein